MPLYAEISTDSPEIIADVVVYGRIVCIFSFGLFLESIWTKILQSGGNMKAPMIAQIVGAAWATVAGQIVAARIVMKKGFRKSPSVKHNLEEDNRWHEREDKSILSEVSIPWLSGACDHGFLLLNIF